MLCVNSLSDFCVTLITIIMMRSALMTMVYWKKYSIALMIHFIYCNSNSCLIYFIHLIALRLIDFSVQIYMPYVHLILLEVHWNYERCFDQDLQVLRMLYDYEIQFTVRWFDYLLWLTGKVDCCFLKINRKIIE